MQRSAAAPLRFAAWLFLLTEAQRDRTNGKQATGAAARTARTAQRERDGGNSRRVEGATTEKFARSVALLRAALDVWEAKHGVQTASVWKRRSQCEGS